MIDILIPVLDRPDNALKVVNSIETTTKVDHSILFLCSRGDEWQIMACKRTGAQILIDDFGFRSQYPKKMNCGFDRTGREFVLLAADDLDFQPGWDEQALRVAEETGAGVIGTNDCCNAEVIKGRFATHPLVRRSYIKEQGGSLDGPGLIFHVGYDHNFCDRELSHLAQFRGQWAFAPKAKIVHRHPMRRIALRDETYKKGMSTFRRDQQLFFRRARGWEMVGLHSQERSVVERTRPRSSRS